MKLSQNVKLDFLGSVRVIVTGKEHLLGDVVEKIAKLKISVENGKFLGADHPYKVEEPWEVIYCDEMTKFHWRTETTEEGVWEIEWDLKVGKLGFCTAEVTPGWVEAYQALCSGWGRSWKIENNLRAAVASQAHVTLVKRYGELGPAHQDSSKLLELIEITETTLAVLIRTGIVEPLEINEKLFLRVRSAEDVFVEIPNFKKLTWWSVLCLRPTPHSGPLNRPQPIDPEEAMRIASFLKYMLPSAS
jgi:hypothetical protein